MTLHHFAGYCLSLLSGPSSTIFKLLELVLLLSITSLVILWLRTYIYKSTLTHINIPPFMKKLSRKYNLDGKIIVTNERKPRAFCLGFLYPKIYLSTGLIKMMNEKEIESIILHEKFHLLSRDTISIAILSLGKYLFFLFPMIGDIIKHLLLRKETKADAFVEAVSGDTKYLKSAFRKLLLGGSSRSLFIPSIHFYTQNFLEERIKKLTGEKSQGLRIKKRNILFTLISFIFLVLAFIFPIQVVDAHENSQMPHVCSISHACLANCSNPQ